MFERLELFLVGLAVIVDTALLLIVRERANRSQVAIWLNILVLGAAAFHLGTFGRVLIENSSTSIVQPLDQIFMVCIVFGLLAMPSGMLHSAVRMLHTGLDAKPKRDLRYAWLYLPFAILPIAAILIFKSDHRSLMQAIAILIPWYIAWIVLANSAAIVCFRLLHKRYPATNRFFEGMIVCLIGTTLIAVAYGAMTNQASWERALRLPVCLAPLMPAGLFVWYSLRQRILPLVMDRTLMYGSLLALGLLFHRLTVTPLSLWVKEHSNIDLIIVESITLIGATLLIPPMRNRASEALRYLFSTNVFKVRDATRGLSVSLSQQSQNETTELLQWFVNELASQLDLDRAVIVIQKTTQTESAHEIYLSSSNQSNLQDGGSDGSATSQQTKDFATLCNAIQSQERLERGRIDLRSSLPPHELTTNREVSDAMERTRTLVAFRSSYRSVVGAVLLGDRRRNDRFADQQLISIALLCDQLAATLENKQESNRRILAERNMMQNEKLSVLGLIAGSLAHELRNPLSSMRTIASLTMEELGEEHPNFGDLNLIVSEIDKLTQTTQRLLDSAKPADASKESVEPDSVITRLLFVLSPLAKKLHVEIKTTFECNGGTVASTEVALSEIFFNLIKNGIEAASGQPNAQVLIETQICESNGMNSIRINVSDNGPSIPTQIQRTMFQPFVTGKVDGTGLGLYVVADRVRELKGSIELKENLMNGFDSSKTFSVLLPKLS